ncbi:hypothetical protein LDC91_003517, partial [Salmonella enterica subsp. enterica serovar Typhimurium]|nr:hypothetical protein [Salmonella enterica subsp. enterica serovar Typhimurium]
MAAAPAAVLLCAASDALVSDAAAWLDASDADDEAAVALAAAVLADVAAFVSDVFA